MRGLRVLNAAPMIADNFRDQFHRTVSLMNTGRLTMNGLVTHTADLASAAELFEQAGSDDYVKGALVVD